MALSVTPNLYPIWVKGKVRIKDFNSSFSGMFLLFSLLRQDKHFFAP